MPLVNMVDSVIVVRRLQVAGFDIDMANSLLGQLSGMAIPIVNLPVVIDQAIGMSLVPSISEAYATCNLLTTITLSTILTKGITHAPIVIGIATYNNFLEFH